MLHEMRSCEPKTRGNAFAAGAPRTMLRAYSILFGEQNAEWKVRERKGVRKGGEKKRNEREGRRERSLCELGEGCFLARRGMDAPVFWHSHCCLSLHNFKFRNFNAF